MSTEPQAQVELQIQHCGPFDDDNAFSQVKDRYHSEITPQAVNPQLQNVISNQNILQLTTEVDGVFFTCDRFELVVDMRGYSPENIRCTITGNMIEVTALQNEQQGNEQERCEKSVSMARRYQLPANVNPYNSTCNLSSDGLLYVVVPWNK